MTTQPYRPIQLDDAIQTPGADLIGMVEGIPVNPPNPPQRDIPNEERTIEELLMWWRQPYLEWNSSVEGWEVRCLDGGAWDRPTFIGQAGGLVAALEIAMRPIRGYQLLERAVIDQSEALFRIMQ